LLQLLLPDVHIATGKLLLKLLLGVAFPLLLGLFMKARFETVTGRLNPVAHKISSVFLVLMAVALIINYVNDIIQLIGSGALPVALIFIICSFMTGYLMGGSGKDTRLTLAFMSGGRNAGICLVIAGQVFTDQKVIWMVITTMILMLILLIPASFVAGHFNAGKHKSPAGN
jgi:BASS family bile acid:Na+ symporter